MKILELKFKNLNSLYGEWVIDFSDPEYVSNGIFALTGPTGAGKSTVLDAICLALYGATPRLGKITKSSNEIMSRQTGECYAEVTFESQVGRFNCHWEQHCARKKANGNLTDARHEISDADTGKPIETKKSLVSRVVEEKTGMDFERFTRSILLAQGGFDTFLKADVEQKSKILEQITGTEIYSEISRRVHECQREERDKLNLLQAETSGIVILEMEQENEIKQNIEIKQKQETDLSGKSTETAKSISWLASIDGLKKEISSLVEEEVKLKSNIEIFKPKRDKLDRAIKAASLDGTYATLTELRRQQLSDQTELKTKEDALPKLDTSAKRQVELLKSAEQKTIKVKDDLKAAAPLILKIRSLDQRLTEQKKSVSDGTEACTKEATKIETDKQARAKEQEKRTNTEKSLETVKQYLKDYVQDEWLISGLAGIEEQLNNLLARQKEITQKEADIKNIDTALELAIKKLTCITKQCIINKQELNDVEKYLHKSKDTLSKLLGDNLLREYRIEKETLLREMAYIRKIEEFEDYRAKLEDGKSCPLCGSIEHPFAEGNVPVLDEIEQKIESLTKLISQAEEMDTVINKLVEAETAIHKELNDNEKLENNASNDKKTAEKNLSELNNNLTKLRTSFEELKLAVSGKLQPLGITEIPESEVSLLLESLKSRLATWQEQVRQKTEIEKQLAAIDSEVKSMNAVIETQSTAFAEKMERLTILKKEYIAGSDERKELYGDKNPNDEERRLNKAVEDAEEVEKNARIQNLELQQKLNTIKTHVESLKKRIGQRYPELKKAGTDFISEFKQTGFTDEKQFLEARLATEERDALSARAKELDDKQTNIKSRQKDREARLSTEIAKKVTDKSREELETEFKEYEESLKELRDIIAGLRHKLKENTAAKERVKERQTAIEAQKKECHRWEKLHGLIGSADGKKYRNFAQGLTFELMVSHANRQLEKMTDRYLLIRDEEQPLELNVVDNFQAGEIRSTKNLSGGESFIVSLTLALGLSKMASRKVRVDSLFLDEGFGTLDEDALETSLDTLSSLQQDGKLIGIISHVSALKERISTQITVTPTSGGRSTLIGPGCNKVVNSE